MKKKPTAKATSLASHAETKASDLFAQAIVDNVRKAILPELAHVRVWRFYDGKSTFTFNFSIIISTPEQEHTSSLSFQKNSVLQFDQQEVCSASFFIIKMAVSFMLSTIASHINRRCSSLQEEINSLVYFLTPILKDLERKP